MPRMGAAALSLRGIRPANAEKKSVTFLCPMGLYRYAVNLAEQRGTNITEVMVGALVIDRDLGAQFDDERDRFIAYADARHLDIDRDLSVILAELIRVGLDTVEGRKKK